MIILNGKKLAEKILSRVKKEIEKKHLKLKLVAILVGENPASKIFIKQKEKACAFCGVGFELFKFPRNIVFSELKEEIKKIAENSTVSGIIIQLPLPKNLKAQDVLNLIPPEKDIDILTEVNLGKFYTGDFFILPPVVGGISRFFEKYKISAKRKNVVIIGAGKLVGFPSALWFFGEKATVSVINDFTKNISSFTKKADIIVSGAGKPGLIRGKMVKKGVIVVDVGSGFKKGKISGDVDFKNVSQKASHITPVPGGMGPMTVAVLLENLVKLNTR